MFDQHVYRAYATLDFQLGKKEYKEGDKWEIYENSYLPFFNKHASQIKPNGLDKLQARKELDEALFGYGRLLKQYPTLFAGPLHFLT